MFVGANVDVVDIDKVTHIIDPAELEFKIKAPAQKGNRVKGVVRNWIMQGIDVYVGEHGTK